MDQHSQSINIAKDDRMCGSCKEACSLATTDSNQFKYCNIYSTYCRVTDPQCYVGRTYINVGKR